MSQNPVNRIEQFLPKPLPSLPRKRPTSESLRRRMKRLEFLKLKIEVRIKELQLQLNCVLDDEKQDLPE